MALPAPFEGILPPVCTPLTESGDVDTGSLQRLLDFHLGAGVQGIFLLGTSSETTLLSDRQRATVIETGIKAVADRVPVIVGVLDTSTAAVIDHARTAEAFGADALVVTAPFYVSANQAEIMEHFRRVRAAVDLPILAYDIPVTVHSKLAKETVLQLAREGTIVGIKDSSGDEGNLRSLTVEARDIRGFAIFTGAERTADLSLSYGASGIVPGLGNIDPGAFVRLYSAAMAGDWEAARTEQDRILRLLPLIQSGDQTRMSMFSSVYGSFKSALMLMGVIATNVVAPPMTRFNDAEVEKVRRVLKAWICCRAESHFGVCRTHPSSGRTCVSARLPTAVFRVADGVPLRVTPRYAAGHTQVRPYKPLSICSIDRCEMALIHTMI